MPATVTVNMMTVVHQSSNGISQAFPDVCKTPAAPSPIPLPYPNIAMSSNAADTASTVKADGNPIMIKTSKYAMSSGDEAGSLMGVVSNKIKGSANPQSFSMDVKADGSNVFRQLDMMLQNGGSMPVNTIPGVNMQPPKPGPAKPLNYDKWKIVEVRWSDPKLKCGDMVKIRTKTENYPDGVPVAHVIHKTGLKAMHDLVKGKVSGNAVEIDWITRNGPWNKNPTKLKVKAHGGGGVKESSNELEIEVPQEFNDRVYVPANLNRAEVLQEVTVPVFTIFGLSFGKKKVIRGTGNFVSGEYGYDISVKKGVFQIHCKMKITPQRHVKTGKRLQRAMKKWKSEIESTWDRKWKEHRINCQRGDTCNCPGGCCIFPVRVKCSFVSGGQHVIVKLWPGAPAGVPSAGGNPGWWDSSNWYERLSGNEGNAGVVHAHEFGHTIGMEDEYATGSTIRECYDVPGSVMQRGTKVMQAHWERHPASGKSIHTRFLEGVKDKKYKLIPA